MESFNKDTTGLPVVNLAPVSKYIDIDSPSQVVSQTQETLSNVSYTIKGKSPNETSDGSSMDLVPVSKCNDMDSPSQTESHTQANPPCTEGKSPSETLDYSFVVPSNEIVVAVHENFTCSPSKTSQPPPPTSPPLSDKHPKIDSCESIISEPYNSKIRTPENSIDSPTTSDLNCESQLVLKVTSNASPPVDSCKGLISALRSKIDSLQKNAASDSLANTSVTFSSTDNPSQQTQTTVINSDYTTFTSQSILNSSIDLLDIRPPIFRQYKRKSAKSSVTVNRTPPVAGSSLQETHTISHGNSAQGDNPSIDADKKLNQTSIIDFNEDLCQNVNVSSSDLENSSILESSTNMAHENVSNIAIESPNNAIQERHSSALHEIPAYETSTATPSEMSEATSSEMSKTTPSEMSKTSPSEASKATPSATSCDIPLIKPSKPLTHRKTVFLGPFESSSFAPFEDPSGSSPLLKFGIPVVIESKQDEITVKPHVSSVECLTYVEIRPDLKEEIEQQMKSLVKGSLQISKSELSKSKSEEIFIYTLCDKNFNLNSKYIETTLKCFDCNKTFKQKEHLKKHLRSKLHLHKINEVYQPASSDEANHPAKQGSKRVLSCPVCKKEFRSITNFTQHKNYHFGIKPEVCTCGRAFTSKYDLKRHIEKVHKKIKPYTCSVCDKEFAWKGGLSNHMMLHSGIKPYKCAECGRCFRRKSHLELHSRTHLTFTEFLCMYCGKQYNSKCQLRIHESSHENRMFECDLCKKKFRDSSCLSHHKRFVHLLKENDIVQQKENNNIFEGQKSNKKSSSVGTLFICSFCGRCCSSKGNLMYHERIHKNEKPYSCTVCGKSFRGKYDLQNHMIIYHDCHKSSRKNKFVCKLCNKSFISKGSLSDHMNIHTGSKPYGCEVCGKRFTQRAHLNTHLRIHRNLKQFSCSVCGKTFRVKGNLRQHEETHNNSPKRFPCKICNKTFLFNSRLKKHSKVHLTGDIQTMECDQSSGKAAK